MGGKNRSLPSLYALKALLAFVVVTCHAPLQQSWLNIPGFSVELFFAITGYFLYAEDLTKVYSRIGKSVKKLVPIILGLQFFYTLIYPPHLGSITTEYWRYIQWVFFGFNNYVTGHLWYLTALLLGLIFLWAIFAYYPRTMDSCSFPFSHTMGLYWSLPYAPLWKA